MGKISYRVHSSARCLPCGCIMPALLTRGPRLLECPKGEVRRIHLPGTWVNKGKKKDRRSYAPALETVLVAAVGATVKGRSLERSENTPSRHYGE